SVCGLAGDRRGRARRRDAGRARVGSAGRPGRGRGPGSEGDPEGRARSRAAPHAPHACSPVARAGLPARGGPAQRAFDPRLGSDVRPGIRSGRRSRSEAVSSQRRARRPGSEAADMSRAVELQPVEGEDARPRLAERIAALAGMGTGWRTIAAKELSDNILNVRFYVLLAIVGLAAIGTVYFSSQGLKDAAQSVGEQARQYTGQAPLFLLLFTVTGNPLPFPF